MFHGCLFSVMITITDCTSARKQLELSPSRFPAELLPPESRPLPPDARFPSMLVQSFVFESPPRETDEKPDPVAGTFYVRLLQICVCVCCTEFVRAAESRFPCYGR
jgi:hypothetical protein